MSFGTVKQSFLHRGCLQRLLWRVYLGTPAAGGGVEPVAGLAELKQSLAGQITQQAWAEKRSEDEAGPTKSRAFLLSRAMVRACPR